MNLRRVKKTLTSFLDRTLAIVHVWDNLASSSPIYSKPFGVNKKWQKIISAHIHIFSIFGKVNLAASENIRNLSFLVIVRRGNVPKIDV